MAKLIYGMFTSLDGYTEDEHGHFGWGAPEDEGLHSYINELASSVGTYLYGRRMYETMVYWETAHAIPDQPQFIRDWTRQWQAAEKIVYSRTLAAPRSARTGSSASSIPTRFGVSKQTPSTTSLLMVLNSPPRRFAAVLSMSSR